VVFLLKLFQLGNSLFSVVSKLNTMKVVQEHLVNMSTPVASWILEL
jgi:hypothetical protein